MIFAPTFASHFLSGVSHIWRPYQEQQVTRRTVVNRGAAQVGKSLRLQKMNFVDKDDRRTGSSARCLHYIRLSPSPRAVCRGNEVKKEEMVNCVLGRYGATPVVPSLTIECLAGVQGLGGTVSALMSRGEDCLMCEL